MIKLEEWEIQLDQQINFTFCLKVLLADDSLSPNWSKKITFKLLNIPIILCPNNIWMADQPSVAFSDLYTVIKTGLRVSKVSTCTSCAWPSRSLLLHPRRSQALHRQRSNPGQKLHGCNDAWWHQLGLRSLVCINRAFWFDWLGNGSCRRLNWPTRCHRWIRNCRKPWWVGLWGNACYKGWLPRLNSWPSAKALRKPKSCFGLLVGNRL